MKNLKAVIILSLGLVLLACNKNDDDMMRIEINEEALNNLPTENTQEDEFPFHFSSGIAVPLNDINTLEKNVRNYEDVDDYDTLYFERSGKHQVITH